MLSDWQKEQLNAKLSGAAVKERKQGGRNVSYIEGWHAIAEANRIFGFDGWDRETVDLRQLGQPYKNANNNTVVNYACKVRITVRMGGDTVVREGTGFGSGIDKDEGQAHESAIKESETDAMKRGLMTFGNPFGLALYDKSQENVESPQQAKPNPTVGQKNESTLTPEQKTIAWLETARERVKTFAAQVEYKMWKAENEKFLTYIEKNFPDKYEAFTVYVDGLWNNWAEDF